MLLLLLLLSVGIIIHETFEIGLTITSLPLSPPSYDKKKHDKPQAREVDGLVLLYRALLADGLMHALDPTVPDLPFDDAKYGLPLPLQDSEKTDNEEGEGSSGGKKKKKKEKKMENRTRPLRIGWFVDDGFAPATPACRRAVEEARDGLEARGHCLVEWGDVKGAGLGVEGLSRFAQLLGADGAATMAATQLKDEDVDPILKELVFLLGMSRLLRWLVVAAHRLFGWHRIARLVAKGGAKSTAETWALQHEKKLFVGRVLASWKALKLDAVVCPATVTPAVPSGAAAGLSAMCGPTAFVSRRGGWRMACFLRRVFNKVID
jgi:Asp-tRNA(Asn)/Glu-tRNA(Gln) amidotransferase A subunit family amidase